MKWLLAGGLLRKLLTIGRSLITNELDQRDWMTSAVSDFRTGHSDLWFDYIADTGDDPDVMQSLATLLHREFPGASLPIEDTKLGALRRCEHPDLVVGAFVFVGGDTAYYVADETTLWQRFVAPFQRALPTPGDRHRPIFAIPGNHDYYASLVGFNRLFRRTYPDRAPAVMPLPGLETQQDASYVKILLPGEWELWGADIGPHGLDYRQRVFFVGDARPPSRLILCTPSPPVAHDRVQVQGREQAAYARLLAQGDPTFTPDDDGAPLPDGACRLFLSGDTHHYARYVGKERPDRSHLATVVSGGGGAFGHPTEHSAGSLVAAKKYPDPSTSRVQTARALTSPPTIIGGGLLWLVGIALALLFHGTWPARFSDLAFPAVWAATVAISLGVVSLGVWLTVLAAKRRKLLAKRLRAAAVVSLPRPRRAHSVRLDNYILPACLLVVAVLPFIAKAMFPAMDPFAAESVWLVSAIVFVVALTLVGAILGGAAHPMGKKFAFGLLGLVHGLLQVGLTYLLVRQGWIIAAIGVVGMWLGFGSAAAALYRAQRPVLLTLLWLVQGIGIAALLAWHPWPSFATSYPWLLVPLVGVVMTPMQFGFYVLVASAWNGHFNEAGITTRSGKFKQWIRFHVTPDRLTGYVIGVDDPLGAAEVHLVDTFVIEPKASAAR